MGTYMELKLERNTMIVSETDEKGNITYVNDDFCRFAKYTKDELIGYPHNIVRHKDMPKAAFKGLWETIQGGMVWSGIVKNQSKNGDYYWVRATVFPSRCTKGNKKYVSVRVKPTDDEVREAEALYKTL
jgi:aerotaxis receptor